MKIRAAATLACLSNFCAPVMAQTEIGGGAAQAAGTAATWSASDHNLVLMIDGASSAAATISISR